MNDSHHGMHLLLYFCTSTGYYTDNKYMGLINVSTSIHLYISRLYIDLKPCISRLLYGTKCMGLGHASASIHLFVSRYETGTKCMTLCHVSSSIHLYISGLLDRYQMHGFEPCFCFHTLVNQLATRKAPNAWV